MTKGIPRKEQGNTEAEKEPDIQNIRTYTSLSRQPFIYLDTCF